MAFILTLSSCIVNAIFLNTNLPNSSGAKPFIISMPQFSNPYYSKKQNASGLNPLAKSFQMENVSKTESIDAFFWENKGNDPKSELRLLKTKNADRPVIAHLNINFFHFLTLWNMKRQVVVVEYCPVFQIVSQKYIKWFFMNIW